MNREIKFRAFDDGVMIYSHNNEINTDYFQLSWFFNKIREDAIVMQFTGLTDKNGKEIYEGDKILCDGMIGTVKYVNASFIIEWNEDIYSELLGWSDWERGKKNEGNEYEVIGNIYQ